MKRALILLVGLLLPVAAAAPAGATTSRPIAPGVQMVTDGAQCTANFVFRRTTTAANGTRTVHTYVGMAAHCAGLGNSSDTNGCTTKSLPLGTRVSFVVGGNLLSSGTTVGHGTLRYSSWLAMQRARTTNAAACAYNDLALVEVDRANLGKVSPSMPGFGGPTALGAALPAAGTKVYTIGSSSLRGTTQTKVGSVSSTSAWTMTVRTLSPGVPGDSGSGYLDAAGRAVGVLSTIGIFPDTLANGVGSLPREVWFARHHGMSGLALRTGGAFHP